MPNKNPYRINDFQQYSSVKCYGGKIFYRGYNKKTRERIQQKIEYSPTLFIPTQENTGYRLISGKKQNMLPVYFDNIREAKDAIYKNREIENAPSYAGIRDFEYAYIIDAEDGIEPDISLLRIANIDIEVISDDEEETEFPEPKFAKQPIVAITVCFNSKFYTFGLADFKNTDPTVRYLKCENEVDLLAKFLKFWTKCDFDIVTGWNIRGFDIPYIVNRIKNVLGEDFAKKLSPWGMLRAYTAKGKYKEFESYELIGIEMLEYMQLYQKIPHGNATQESYSLEHISQVELDEGKLEFKEEYGTIGNLYRKNPQLFLEYNIHDTRCVDNIDKKLKFISLYCTTAYDSRSNFSDVNMQSVMVDNFIFRYAKEKKLVMPAKKHIDHKDAFAGAFVKDTLAGKYNWIVTCDLTSLYPHLQMQFNISPDTLREHLFERKLKVNEVAETGPDLDLQNKAIKHNCSLAGNGQFFTNEFVGLLPEIQNQMFKDRKQYKKKMLEAEEALSKLKETDPKYKEVEIEALKFKNLQTAKKVQLNSIYGVSGAKVFRFYDTRISEAITLSGQIVIKRITKKINEFLMKASGKNDFDFVIASDTDSTLLNLGPVVDVHFSRKEQREEKTKIINWLDEYTKKELEPFIDETFRELASELNCLENKMHMKREKIAEAGIFTKKKRYALLINDEEGIRYKEPKLKTVGLETVKSSTPKLMRQKLKDALILCLTKDEKDLQDYFKKFKEEVVINNKYSPEEIATNFNAGGMVKYHVEPGAPFKLKTPFHIKGALFHNHLIHILKLKGKVKEIELGDKIKILKLNEPNKWSKDYISFVGTQLPKAFKIGIKDIDMRHQFDTTFTKPLSAIAETCGWSLEKRKSLI